MDNITVKPDETLLPSRQAGGIPSYAITPQNADSLPAQIGGSKLWQKKKKHEPCKLSSKEVTMTVCMYAVLTGFSPLGHALSLSGGVDRNHSGRVDRVGLQVLQHSVQGAAWYLDLGRSTPKA